MHGDNCKFFRWFCTFPFRLATCANYSQLVSTTGNRSYALCHSLSKLRGATKFKSNDGMQHHRL